MVINTMVKNIINKLSSAARKEFSKQSPDFFVMLIYR